MTERILFPNDRYRAVLKNMVQYFEVYPGIFAIVLTGSLARGKAVRGSCIDLFVFVEREQFEKLNIKSREKAYASMGGKICYYNGEVEGGIMFGDVRVDIGFTYGEFQVGHNPFDVVRDEFETTIGNLFVHCVPLFQKSTKYQRLKSKYLPYYSDTLRRERLDGTNEEFYYKTWKTRWLASRGEYFSALETLLEARRIFLQHLFIKERKYPIDYTKWLKEQCETILGMQELYPKLVTLVDGIKLSKRGIAERTTILEQIMRQCKNS